MCSHACVMWNHTPTVSQHKSHSHMDLRTVAGMARGRWIRGWREDGLQMIIWGRRGDWVYEARSCNIAPSEQGRSANVQTNKQIICKMASCSNVFCEFCAFCESVKQFCEFCELCAFCEFCELRVKPPLQPCQKGFYEFCEFCELWAFCELSFIIFKCLCTIRRIRKLFTGFKWYVQALATSRNRHMKTNTPELTGTVANAPFHAMVYLKDYDLIVIWMLDHIDIRIILASQKPDILPLAPQAKPYVCWLHVCTNNDMIPQQPN